jgi:formamidopyrimidine-DNA glycosylase
MAPPRLKPNYTLTHGADIRAAPCAILPPVPELPEVDHIVRYVRPALVGRRIASARVVDRKGGDHQLAGRRIETVERRAKLIIIKMSPCDALVFHLKLTGKLWIRPRGAAPARFTRLVVELDRDALHFDDTRRLGWWRVLDDAALDRLVAPLGPEPLEPSFTRAHFADLLAERRGRLKPLLLDQTFVAGIGNIYADEILFAARLHPLRDARSLAPREIAALHRSILSVLRRAVADRGDEDVPDQERVGQGGRGAARRIRTRKVFQRDGEPCPRCKTTIERIVVQGRGTHLCPRCQSRKGSPR